MAKPTLSDGIHNDTRSGVFAPPCTQVSYTSRTLPRCDHSRRAPAPVAACIIPSETPRV